MSNPFDQGGMGGMGGLMGLLGGFQQRMEEVKQRAAATEVEGVASGGLVRVKMTCDLTVTSVEIAEGAMGDRELLEDLCRAAMGEAVQKARDEMQKGLQELAGGLPIPPGLLGF